MAKRHKAKVQRFCVVTYFVESGQSSRVHGCYRSRAKAYAKASRLYSDEDQRVSVQSTHAMTSDQSHGAMVKRIWGSRAKRIRRRRAG